MRGVAPRRSLLLAAAIAFAASPAVAQSIRATARNARTGAPLPEALVRAVGADGAQVAAGFASESGVVVLRLRGPGTYRVEAQRSGYHPTSVQVEADGREVPAEIRMTRRPFVLDTVVVLGSGAASAAATASSGGSRWDRACSWTPRTWRRPGSGRRTSTTCCGASPACSWCGPAAARRAPARGGGGAAWCCWWTASRCRWSFANGHRRELHQMVAPGDVKGVEVYREFSEVPQEFRRHACNGMYGCGVYLYWTRARW